VKRGLLPGRAAVRTLVGAARYRLTGHRMPLTAWIAVTTRCNALCRTCSIPLRKVPELATEPLVAIIDGLAERGCVRINFTGGEPLLRDDLGVLVERAAAHGVFASVETNGYLYPQRAAELDAAGELVVALDGGRDAHDANREPGSFVRAMAAIELATRRGLRVRTMTTITRHNVDTLDDVLDLAAAHGFVADFQLLEHAPMLAESLAQALAAPPEALRRALLRLVEARRAGRPVAPSERLLRYVRQWGDYGHTTSDDPREDVHCLAGQLFVSIEPDGTVLPCPLWSRRYPGRSAATDGLDAALDAVRDNPCRACTSPVLTETNYLYNLNGPAVAERVRALATHALGRKGPA
jgi:MoaA/NifB/PqqE/SkfB family radical SAM enzyme